MSAKVSSSAEAAATIVKVPTDFGARVDQLARKLFELGRLKEPTQAALARASGVDATAFSHSRSGRGFSTNNQLLLWKSLGVMTEYWTDPEVRDVVFYLQDVPPFGPRSPDASDDYVVPTRPLPVEAPIDNPWMMRRTMLEVVFERHDLPDVGKAILAAEPPSGQENNLVWWLTYYEDARDAAREATSKSELDRRSPLPPPTKR